MKNNKTLKPLNPRKARGYRELVLGSLRQNSFKYNGVTYVATQYFSHEFNFYEYSHLPKWLVEKVKDQLIKDNILIPTELSNIYKL